MPTLPNIPEWLNFSPAYWLRYDYLLVLVVCTALVVGGLVIGLDNPIHGSSDIDSTPATSAQYDDAAFAGHALLDVFSSPRDAHVVVDGDTLGPTPLLQYSLRAGSHKVEIMRPGYTPIDTTVTLRSDQPNRLIISMIETRPRPGNVQRVNGQTFHVAPEQFDSARKEQRDRVQQYLSRINQTRQATSAIDDTPEHLGW